MIILRATNDSGVKVDLDVLESNAPIKLDISAIENTNIGQAFGVSSQTFSLPGTPTNNAFFGNLYNLGATPAVALQNSIPCQVLTDGAEVFTGKLYITDIVTDQKGYTTYQVNVVNETVDFKFQLTDTLLSQIDFSEYDHAYTFNNITGSWEEKLFSGSIIYPHVNYGQPEGDTVIAEYGFGGTRTFDKIFYPLRIDQFKPAIKVKDVVDKIFEQTDYTYTSSFFNSTYFNNLYSLTTPSDGLGALNANPATGSVWAYSSTTQNFNALTSTKVNFNAEVFDDFSRYNLATDRYTAYGTGLYQFAFGCTFSITNYNVNNRGRFFIRLAKNGTNLGPSRVYPNVPASGALYVPFPNISLNVTDYIEAFIEYQTDNGSEVITLGAGQNNTYFKVIGPASTLGGGTVNIAKQFPNDLKAVDFLQGIIEKFNLVVEPVPNTRNLLRIEPYNTWVGQGKIVDWTDRVDRSVRFKIVHPISEQPKFIYFRDEDDEAVNNKYTKENFGDTFGTYTYTNDSDLCQGERTVGKVFAATPVKGIPNGENVIIPHLSRKDPEDGVQRPFKFKPRLLHKNGLKDITSTAQGIGATTTRGTYFMVDEVSNIRRLSQYYQMSTFDNLPTSFTTGSDLHFGNLNWYQYFQPTGINGRTRNDAFQTYWANYINSLYDIDARKLTCNIFLRPNEIQDIALNDKIFIDGQYYRINKISGANISYEDTIEVELIKELNRQIPYPRRRTVVGNVAQDILVREVQESGKVVYEDFDGGQTVEDYGRIIQAAPKDGYTVFENTGNSGSVTWDLPALVTVNDQKSVVGTNNVDSSANSFFVAGGNNTVANNTSNGLVSGNNNEVKAGSINATIIGVDNTIEVLQENVTILGAVGAALSGSNNNSMIIGGTGSIQYNNDWGVQINGYTDGLRDSDSTTAITSGENEVIINGSGHTVLTLNREGAGLDLLEKRNKSNYLGDTYFGGGILIDSYTINVGDGTNYFLTGSAMGGGKHESVYLLNWNGLSPGTASINLPNAANNDYKGVQYTFKANGTFDGTTYLRLVPFTAGQDIDGQATLAFSSSYDVVTIFNTGSDWYTLSGGVGTGGGGALPTGSFGNFFSSASQALVAPGVSQSVTLTSTYPSASQGVYFASGSRIYFVDPGVYQFTYVAQISNTSTGPEDANFWIKYNGVDYPNSNTFVSVIEEKNPANPSYQLMSATFTGVAQNANDYIELYWNGTSTDLSLYATGSGANGAPATPSVIANIIEVAGGGAFIPSLQQVTAVGNTTSINVELNGGVIVSSSFSSSVDARINSINIGRGADNNITNFVAGVSNMISASGDPDTNEGNVFIGHNAAKNFSSGYQNVGIGREAFAECGNDLAYATAIGAYAFKSASISLDSYHIGIGAFAGTYTTDNRRFVVNAHDRGSADGDTTGSLLYGALDPISSSQALRVNASRFALPYLSQSLYGHIVTYNSGSEDKGFDRGRLAFTPIGRIGFPYTGSGIVSGSLTVIGNTTVTGSLGTSGSFTLTGSLNATGTTTLTGSLNTSGSVAITGSLRGNYVILSATATASIDCSRGNFFDVTLTGSGATHISASNVAPGQTINIIVNTGAATTGSVTFNNVFVQPTGSDYVPTVGANKTDALSAVSALYNNDPKLYVVSVKNFV